MTGLESNDVEVGEAPFPDPQGKTQLFISEIPSVGKNRYNRLLDNGFNTLNDLYQSSESEITAIDGIGKRTAREIKIWVGDQLVEMNNISASQMNAMSVEEIVTVYNISERAANEVKDRYQAEVEAETTHLSEVGNS